MLLFPEMQVTRKIFTRAASNLFFLIDLPEILSFGLVSFGFFVFLFFLLTCLFFEIKNIYSDTHLTVWASK